MTDTFSDAKPAAGAEASDGSLLRRFCLGSDEAATHLYLRYAHRLRALARAHCPRALARHVDPEDIVQSVFRRFFQRARQGCYDVPAGEELWALLLVMALNRIRTEEAYCYAARRDVRRTAGDQLLDRPGAGAEEADRAFFQLVIQEALGQLPDSHRTILGLRLEGYEVAEIARRTQRSKRTVERILQEARAELRAFFDESN